MKRHAPRALLWLVPFCFLLAATGQVHAGIGQIESVIRQMFGGGVNVSGTPNDGEQLTYVAASGEWQASSAGGAALSTDEITLDIANADVFINRQGSGKIGIGSGSGDALGQIQASAFIAVDSGALLLGTGNDVKLFWDPNQVTANNCMLALNTTGLAAGGGALVITSLINIGEDHDLPVRNNPALAIFSGKSPDLDNADWLLFEHNQTNASVQWGSGDLSLGDTSGGQTVRFEGTGDATIVDGGLTALSGSFTSFLYLPDNITHNFGDGNGAILDWSTAQVTANNFVVGLLAAGDATGGGTLVLTTRDNVGKDHDLAVSTLPQLAVFSSTDPDSANDEAIILRFPTTFGEIVTLSGGITLSPANSTVTVPTLIVTGNINCADDDQLIMGSSGTDSLLDWSTGQATANNLVWGITAAGDTTGGGTLILTETSNVGKDHDLPVSTLPQLAIFSSTDPDSANDEWISFKHDVTDGAITTGSGALNFVVAGTERVTMETAGILAVSGQIGIGATTTPDLYLSRSAGTLIVSDGSEEDGDGTVQAAAHLVTGSTVQLSANICGLGSAAEVQFAAAGSAGGAKDTYIGRSAAGTVLIGATTGTADGHLQAAAVSVATSSNSGMIFGTTGAENMQLGGSLEMRWAAATPGGAKDTFFGRTSAGVLYVGATTGTADGALSLASIGQHAVTGHLTVNDDNRIRIGTSADAFIEWDVIGQTNDTLLISPGDTSNSILVVDNTHAAVDYAHGNYTDSTLVLHKNAATTGTYLALSHGAIAGGLMASDAATTDLLITAQDAYPLSTATNLTGSDLILAGGLGTKDTEVIDYTQTGYTVTVTVNGTATVLTEGVDWTNVTSNAVSAAALATPLSAISGVSATVNAGAVVDITPDAGTYSLSVSETGTGNTATNGADGGVITVCPAVASYYWSSTAATANETDTPIKCAGTTASLQAEQFTVATTNRATYTGTMTRKFLVTITTSFTTSAATTSTLYIAVDGSVVTGLELNRLTTNTDEGAWALSGVVSLAENAYVEVWCATNDGDDITVEAGTVTITALP